MVKCLSAKSFNSKFNKREVVIENSLPYTQQESPAEVVCKHCQTIIKHLTAWCPICWYPISIGKIEK